MERNQPAAVPPQIKRVELKPGVELTLTHDGPGSTCFVITTAAGDIFRAVLTEGQDFSFTPASTGCQLTMYGSDLDEVTATRNH